MIKNSFYSILLYSVLLCQNSFAFSNHRNHALWISRQQQQQQISPICFITSKSERKRISVLYVASPASDLKENKEEKKRSLRRLRESLKKYLISKPRSLFRKEKNSLMNQAIVSTDENQEMGTTIAFAAHSDNSSGLLEATSTIVETDTPRITQSTTEVDTTIDLTVDSELPSEVLAVSNIAESDITTRSTAQITEQEISEDLIPETTLEITVPVAEEETEVLLDYEANTEETRWALSASNVDFTGEWKIVTTDQFKKEYDVYLSRLGQPALVRSVAVNIVDFTVEDVVHDGTKLTIRGKNLRGCWDRTLITSGFNTQTGEFIDQIENPVQTADRLETIHAESWWEERGTVHVSWMKGVKRYGGGDFESRRYLEDNGKILVCDTIFHPEPNSNAVVKEKATIQWKFQHVD